MLLIHCPYCEDARPELEFRQSGEAHLKRPDGLAETSDRDVAVMLYFRSNERGLVFERWRHVHGCGRFFNAARNSLTDKFFGTYKAGLPKPSVDAAGKLVFPVADAASDPAAASAPPVPKEALK